MTNSTGRAPGIRALASRFLLAFAFAAVIGALSMPAYAQHHEDDRRGVERHDDRHDRDRHDHDWGRSYRPYGGVYVAPQPYGYYDPPPVVYGPPPPSVGFSFVFP